jgi:hypothetical protein
VYQITPIFSVIRNLRKRNNSRPHSSREPYGLRILWSSSELSRDTVRTFCRAPRRSVDILVNLMRRLNVNVGGMFTGTRDNDGQWASQYDGGALGMYSGCQSNKDAFEKVTSKSTQSQGNVNVVGVAMTDSVTSTTSHPSMGMSLSNDGSCEQANSSSLSTGNGIDSLFTDMNFDFDPLFGFDMDQADFLQDISF